MLSNNIIDYPDLLDIICDYLHCDLISVPNGYELKLRPCKFFEVVTHNGTTMVFPCTTQ